MALHLMQLFGLYSVFQRLHDWLKSSISFTLETITTVVFFVLLIFIVLTIIFLTATVMIIRGLPVDFLEFLSRDVEDDEELLIGLRFRTNPWRRILTQVEVDRVEVRLT